MSQQLQSSGWLMVTVWTCGLTYFEVEFERFCAKRNSVFTVICGVWGNIARSSCCNVLAILVSQQKPSS